uniref:Uncharacterized protein n=1 Tax=Romanomermis culicivorax TaxID=13658 RepID=A0A915HUX1_ROMCU
MSSSNTSKNEFKIKHINMLTEDQDLRGLEITPRFTNHLKSNSSTQKGVLKHYFKNQKLSCRKLEKTFCVKCQNDFEKIFDVSFEAYFSTTIKAIPTKIYQDFEPYFSLQCIRFIDGEQFSTDYSN